MFSQKRKGAYKRRFLNNYDTFVYDKKVSVKIPEEILEIIDVILQKMY